MAGYGNNRNFYGTIIAGRGKQEYTIRFEDDLPANNRNIQCLRKNIKVVSIGEEEVVTYYNVRRNQLEDKSSPDFGIYMLTNYFKVFMAAAPYCWCDEKYWYIDKRDRPWDIFLPIVPELNNKREAYLLLAC